MSEYISREAVFDWFCESADIGGCVDLPRNNGSCKKGCRCCTSGKELDEIPAADVVERKRGTWQKRMETSRGNGYKAYTPVWSCSNCGKDYDPAICSAINFCYRCGADMREER